VREVLGLLPASPRQQNSEVVGLHLFLGDSRYGETAGPRGRGLRPEFIHVRPLEPMRPPSCSPGIVCQYMVGAIARTWPAVPRLD
jgi:hypothetical protein